MKELILFLKLIFRIVFLALKALLHPENEYEWRMAYAYFVFPVFFIGGLALLVSLSIIWLIPSPFDWMLTYVWLFYILIGEPYMYYIEGDGFARWDHWIRTGRTR